MVVNLLGPSNSHNAVLATLGIIKGRPLPLDVCSVTQQAAEGGPVRRSLSFLSVAFGLMADLDIGTEHLRWMGDTRFTVGFIEGAIANRKQPCRLDIQVIEEDRERIRSEWKRRRTEAHANQGEAGPVNGAANGHKGDPSIQGLPPLSCDVTTDLSSAAAATDGAAWVTLEQDITTLYAGTLPWVASMLLQFPAKIAGDGSVDVVVLDSPSTMRTLACIEGAEKGSCFRNPNVSAALLYSSGVSPC